MKYRDILLLVNVTATNDVYPTIIQYAKEHGWRLTIEDRMAPPSGWHGDGAIMQAMDYPITMRYAKYLTRKGIPIVNLMNGKMERSIPSCIFDIPAISRLAAAHFREHGFRHVAFFSMECLHVRAMQYKSFASAWGKSTAMKWIWQDAAKRRNVNNRAAFMKWIKDMLADAPKPIAILCANSYNAVSLLNVCLDMGLSVPDDAAILSSQYDPAFCDCQTVPISGIEIDSRLQAKEAAALLDRLIVGKRIGSKYILIPPTRIIVQQSTDVLATENPILRQALQFIRENLSHPFGAAEIAEHLAVPRVKLDRLFASELKRSAGAEIMRQRIAKAKKMLDESNATLAAIAMDTGFCHASYLISAFKKAVGTTPRRYRAARKPQRTPQIEPYLPCL